MFFILSEFAQQTAIMGVSYTDNDTTCPNKEGHGENVNEVKMSSIYRSNEIYKDCSYQLPSIHLFKTKKRNPLSNPKLEAQINREFAECKQSFNSQNYWSKVYHSPITDRQCKVKQVEQNTSSKQSSDIQLDTNHLESLQNDTNIQACRSVPTENIATSMTSFVKSKQSVKARVKGWYKMTFPRMLCPCCTGGDDGPAPYCAHSAAGSYESIDLKLSNNALHSLDLDASLMSIIHMHRSLKLKRTSKDYAKIISAVLNNTYKNAIDLISSRKQ